MAHLTPAEIRWLAEHAAEAGVDPEVLRAMLSPGIVARLTRAKTSVGQLLLDLNALNTLAAVDGELPLVTYLHALKMLLLDPTDVQSILARLTTGSLDGRSASAARRAERPPGPASTARPIDVGRLIHYAPDRLIGREAELGMLNDAWLQAQAGADGRPRLVSLVALGGEGKTALVAHWLAALAETQWPGVEAVFAWSFYSQGTGGQAASSDLFLNEALGFFGDPKTGESGQSADNKARRLVELLRARRVLLVLDGLEPLQYPPTSPLRGKLKDAAVGTLLKGLAMSSPGLCVLTTRYAVADLDGLGRNLRRYPIERLSTEAGVALLEAQGVHGPAPELEAAVEAVGHALTLHLLGSYLCDAYGGDVWQRKQVSFEAADAEQGGHAFRVMDSYAAWFETSGAGREAMALLRVSATRTSRSISPAAS